MLVTPMQAYRKNMLYPTYVWITYGWYNDNHWWKSDGNKSKCSEEEMSAVLNGSIAISHYPVLYSDESSSHFNHTIVSSSYNKH